VIIITNRRNVLKTGTGILAAGLLPVSLFAQTASPFLIGVCSELGDLDKIMTSDIAYLEPPVYDFLIPKEPEINFQKKLDIVKNSKLLTPVCNSFIGGDLKSVGPNHVKDDVLKYAEVAFKRAQRAGVEQIVYGSGGSRRIPDGFSKIEARAQFVSLLTDMAPLAQKYGVNLCLEPLRSEETNFINFMQDGVDILEEVNHPNAMLVCDYYHVTQEGRGVNDVYAARKYIKHVHIAEDQERAPPGVFGEDFRSFFKMLNEIGYAGRISIEANWTDKASELPIGIRTLNRQIAAL
jgi:sugar phosphate isomerase/epimerase